MKKLKKSVRVHTERSRSGFTLVELLIVIAIIAILAVIVSVVINPIEIMKQGRDSDRMAALASLQQAIGVAAQDATVSGAEILCVGGICAGDSFTGSRSTDGTGWVKVDLSGQKTVSLPTLPVDQINNQAYHYTYNASDGSWEVDAVLESKKYEGKMENDGGDNPAKYEVGSNLKVVN